MIQVDNMPAIELVPQANYLPQEPDGTEHQEGVLGLDQDQNFAQDIATNDEILDVICMMLDTEGEKLQYQSNQLSSLIILSSDRISDCIG